jgi:cobalt-precorrin-7 (C5)-methyltransferase
LAKINIVGVGPGSPDYVTPAARKAVQTAQVVIGAQRSLNLFQPNIEGETLILTAKNLQEAIKYAAESAKKGKIVTFLSTGDPGFSGLLHTILKSDLTANIEINVVAGVSSIQACAARLKISWDKACLFTFHEGNVTAEQKNQLLFCLKNRKDVILLPDARAFPPKEIASFLINEGIGRKSSVYICENLTLDNEKVTESYLKDIVGLAFVPLCVMVIKPSTN